MPANEFEKQVQKQLEQLRLEPSASVWENVEKEIREKKRRRIIFFFILPLALWLLGFSFYQFLYKGKKTVTVQQPVPANKENLLSPGHSNSAPQVNEAILVPATGDIHNDEETAIKKEITGKRGARSNKAAGAEIAVSSSLVRSLSQEGVTKNNNVPVNMLRKQDDLLVVTVEAPGKIKTIPGDEPVKTGTEEIAAGNSTAEIKRKDEENKISGDELATVKNDSSRKKEDVIVTGADKKEESIAQKKKSSPKIKWGIDLSGGLSFNTKGTLTFARTEALDVFFNSPAASSGYGNAPVYVIPPSPVSEGLSSRAGLVAEWQASTRSSFAAGLQYVYSSNRIKVGRAADTTVTLTGNSLQGRINVQKVYKGSQENNYTNSFHFLRLPLSYHWKISRNRKLPVEWNAGAGISYLFSTNALMYSGSLGGIYYRDKNAFNKLHFDLATGFSLRFAAKNKAEWMIGPSLSFDMTPLVKNVSKQYMMFGGISARFLFPQKKNK
jgi:hypothetical protein